MSEERKEGVYTSEIRDYRRKETRMISAIFGHISFEM